VFTSLCQPTIQIDIDRARAARYGLSPGDYHAVIKVAIAATAPAISRTRSDRHFPIIVRLAPEYRRAPRRGAVANLRIGAAGPNGHTHIPRSEWRRSI